MTPGSWGRSSAPRPRGRRDDAVFDFQALGAHFPETGRDDNEPLDALRDGILDGQQGRLGENDNRQVHLAGTSLMEGYARTLEIDRAVGLTG